MILSGLGITLGVAFFIAAQAQTQGFEKFFINTSLGTSGSIVISDRFREGLTQSLQNEADLVEISGGQSRKYFPGIIDAYRIIRVLDTFPNVVAAAPVIEDKAILRTGIKNEAVSVYGIDLNLHLKTTDLASQIQRGSLDDFRNDPSGVLIGSALAEKLEIQPGSNLFLYGPDMRPRRFRVAAYYQTGINAIDERRIYLHRRAAQNVLQFKHSASLILVRLRDPSKAVEEALTLERLLSHRARAWQQREQGNLTIFRALRVSAAVTVSTIILLSGFGIFNVLSLSVMEKLKEIAILRSMGYTRRDISRIFLWQGAGIAAIGISAGCILGALLTDFISRIPIKLRGVIRSDYFVVHWSGEHYLYAACLAAIAVFIAAWAPARRAAALDPIQILRGSGQ
ncbi:MAG: ABC transporter permease [Methylacidiphilales bacterium]|nr:ABC transporter permease [Candidatus Methylacidiphilales bacterium]